MKVLNSLLIAISLFYLPDISTAQTRYRGMTLGGDLTSSDIDDLGELKPTTARYLFSNYGTADTQTGEEYLAWLDTAMAELDALLPSFEANGIKIVLNLYTPPGGFESYKSPPRHRIFAEQAFQDLMVQVWETITSHYNGNTNIWGFDILNEPAQGTVAPGLKNWNELISSIVPAIRAIDPNRTIIIEPVYGDQARFASLKPLTESNIVYSFHMYYPNQFRDQGFEGRPINVSYPKKRFNKRALSVHMKRAMAFQAKNSAQMYVGEFSAVRWAPNNSAYRYLRDLINIFEKKGWSWTYHSWRDCDCWSVEHDTNPDHHNKTTTMTDRAQLLASYFSKP